MDETDVLQADYSPSPSGTNLRHEGDYLSAHCSNNLRIFDTWLKVLVRIQKT
jgi:hypothetical protein